MKPNLLVTSLIFLISTSICAQHVPIEVKEKYFPRNTVEIRENYLYMAQTEVSNIQYTEFLYAMRKNDEQTYLDHLPDTLVWRDKRAYHEPYVEYYFRHPAYQAYPVVGVSYEQAQNFCKWLGDVLNDQFSQNDKSPIQKVIVRLPTKKEWEAAARADQGDHIVYPWGSNELTYPNTHRKMAGNYRSNHLHNRRYYAGQAGHLNDMADITAPVKSYEPNPWGLYNMSGNLAEMVQEKGISKGGSWRTRPYYIRIDVDQNYEGVQPDLGFRYVVEVVEYKSNESKKTPELTAKLIEDYLSYIPAGSTYGFAETEEGVRFATQTYSAFYMSKFEVSNQLYRYFINDLNQTNPQQAQSFAPNDDNWLHETPYQYVLNYSKHEAWNNFPVANISHEAAEAFCAWLTKTYATFKDKKYPGLQFRLPSSGEFRYAAKGGLELSSYPWGGPYLKNAKGCYLANFAPLEERFNKYEEGKDDYYDYPNGDTTQFYDKDGGYFTVPVDSYYPNDYGLYNMGGNVSEMVVTPGVSKGGSWKSMPYYLKIDNDPDGDGPYSDQIKDYRIYEIYNGPDPRVGFRFVADVMEETETARE